MAAGTTEADRPPSAPAWAYGCCRETAHIGLSGNDAADGAWLAEFLFPWCDPAPTDGAPVQVRMVRDDTRFGTLSRQWEVLRTGPEALDPIASIRLDTQTVGFSGWRQGQRLHLADPVAGCFFVLDGMKVDIVAPAARDQSRIALLGLVREAVAGRVAGDGPVLDLHAAAFVANGRAVLLAGPKMAGKTTLLCHMLLSGGAALLSNDRTFVHLDGAAPVACGIPTVGSFRPGTLARFPQLSERADTYPASHFTPPGAAPAPGLRLTPARLAGRLGIMQVPRAPLQAVLLPEINAEISGYALEPLSGGRALASLAACLYGVPEDRDRPTLFAGLAGPPRSAQPVERRLERLVAAVPVLRLVMGADVYDGSARPILAALGLEAP